MEKHLKRYIFEHLTLHTGSSWCPDNIVASSTWLETDSMRMMSAFGYSASLWKAHSQRTRGTQGTEVYVDCS